ncbi:hypothetical protein C8F04DRAFT_1275977 [Mycena alexandri]|uniref:Uncharacterized protein n=1 Tax=Mycena alexandri TaxID=1745969 RepID=A0AAD6S2K0_9AGAR|nr:hypothetical protein C8F04DRAFT_1275977 [Mycena alexandri]
MAFSLNLFFSIPRKLSVRRMCRVAVLPRLWFFRFVRSPSVPRTPRQCLSLSLRQPRHAYGFFRANCLLPSPYSLRTPRAPRQCPS